MKKPDARQREAIEALQARGAQWVSFLTWLRACRDDAYAECVRADDETHVRRAQGMARCLDELADVLTPK